MSTEFNIAKNYLSSLEDLNVNSKPLINSLTLLAEDNLNYASILVQVIEHHISKTEHFLPSLYLMDSILKNVGKQYINLFAKNIVNTFGTVFSKVDEKTRTAMFRLRQTWKPLFTFETLHAMDVRVNSIDPAWPVVSQNSSDDKLKTVASGADQNSKGSCTVHVNRRVFEKPQPSKAPEHTVNQTSTISNELIAQKKIQLLELQIQKLELEIEHVVPGTCLMARQQQLLDLRTEKAQIELHMATAKLAHSDKPIKTQHTDVLRDTVSVSTLDPRLRRSTTVRSNETDTTTSALFTSSKPQSLDIRTTAQLDPRIKRRDTDLSSSEPPTRSFASNLLPVATVTAARSVKSSFSTQPLSTQLSTVSSGTNSVTTSSRKSGDHLVAHIMSHLTNSIGTSRTQRPPSSETDHVGHNDHDMRRAPKRSTLSLGSCAPVPSQASKRPNLDVGGQSLSAAVSAAASSASVTARNSSIVLPSVLDRLVAPHASLSVAAADVPCSVPARPRSGAIAAPVTTTTARDVMQPSRTENVCDRPLHSVATNMTAEAVCDTDSRTVLPPTNDAFRVGCTGDVDLRSLHSDFTAGNNHTLQSQSETVGEKKSLDVLLHSEADTDLRNLQECVTSEEISDTNDVNTTSEMLSTSDVDLRSQYFSHDAKNLQQSDQAVTEAKSNEIDDLFGSQDVDLRHVQDTESVFTDSERTPAHDIDERVTDVDMRSFGIPPLLNDETVANKMASDDDQKQPSDATQVPPPSIDAATNNSGHSDVSDVAPECRQNLVSCDPLPNRVMVKDPATTSVKRPFCEVANDLERPITGTLNQDLADVFTARPRNLEVASVKRHSPDVTAKHRFPETEILDRRLDVTSTTQQYPDFPKRPFPRGNNQPIIHPADSNHMSSNFHMPRNEKPNWIHPNKEESVFRGRNRFPMPNTSAVPKFAPGPNSARTNRMLVPGLRMKTDFPEVSPLLVSLARDDAANRMQTCINDQPCDILWYGHNCVCLSKWDEPCMLYFKPGIRQLSLNNRLVPCRFNDSDRQVTLEDGSVHDVRLGFPTREVFVDGRGYQLNFGAADPLTIVLDGGKSCSLSVSGPLPGVDIGRRRLDLCLGKCKLFINEDKSCPVDVFLDCTWQLFRIDERVFVFRFVEGFNTIEMNGVRIRIDFDSRSSVPIFVDGRRHAIRFGSAPARLMNGARIHVHGMAARECDRDWPLPWLDAEILANVTDQQLPPITLIGHPPPQPFPSTIAALPVPPTCFPSAVPHPGAVPVPPILTNTSLLPSNVAVTLPPSAAFLPDSTAPLQCTDPANTSVNVTTALPPVNIDISNLNKILNSLMGSKLPLPVNPSPAQPSELFSQPSSTVQGGVLAEPQTSVPSTIAQLPGIHMNVTGPAADFLCPVTNQREPEFKCTAESLKMRHNFIINRLHIGIQCSSCGKRFISENCSEYSNHLDWHFRQNHRLHNKGHPPSRQWLLPQSLWLEHEHIELPNSVAGLDYDNTEAVVEVENGVNCSAPVFDLEEDNKCQVCHEEMVKFYHEESEEWHLRNCIRVEEKAYHPKCFEDHKTSLLMASLRTQSSADSSTAAVTAGSTEDGAVVARDSTKCGSEQTQQSVAVSGRVSIAAGDMSVDDIEILDVPARPEKKVELILLDEEEQAGSDTSPRKQSRNKAQSSHDCSESEHKSSDNQDASGTDGAAEAVDGQTKPSSPRTAEDPQRTCNTSPDDTHSQVTAEDMQSLASHGEESAHTNDDQSQSDTSAAATGECDEQQQQKPVASTAPLIHTSLDGDIRVSAKHVPSQTPGIRITLSGGRCVTERRSVFQERPDPTSVKSTLIGQELTNQEIRLCGRETSNMCSIM